MHAALAMWRPARAVCRKLTCRKSQDTKATAKWLFSAIAANAVHFLSFTLPQPDARISSKCKQEYPRIFTADGQVFWMLLLAISGKLLGMKQITVSFNCDFPRALASCVVLLYAPTRKIVEMHRLWRALYALYRLFPSPATTFLFLCFFPERIRAINPIRWVTRSVHYGICPHPSTSPPSVPSTSRVPVRHKVSF